MPSNWAFVWAMDVQSSLGSFSQHDVQAVAKWLHGRKVSRTDYFRQAANCVPPPHRVPPENVAALHSVLCDATRLTFRDTWTNTWRP